MRNRDKRKLEEEHSGQVTGFTGFYKRLMRLVVEIGLAKDPLFFGNGNCIERSFWSPVTVYRFIIDPARAYRYFSAVTALLRLLSAAHKACLLDAQALFSD